MSYFTKTTFSEWDSNKALDFYLNDSENENEAFQKMKNHVMEILANVNTKPLARKKAQFLLKKIPCIESTSSTLANAINHNTYNMKDNSNINNNVNNYINNNGKRNNDIFNTSGGENTDFVNKLLKATIPIQEEEDLEEEDEEQLQASVVFGEEDNGELCSKLNSTIKVWKANQAYEPVIHKQQLLYYNSIDTSLDASPLSKEDLDLIAKKDMHVYIEPSQTEPPDINLNSCNSFKSLKKIYDDDKHKMPFAIKKMVKTYINQRYEEHVNLFTDYTQKEDDYKFHFVSPLFKALFGPNENIKKEWGESFVFGKTKVDGLLSILDDEGLVAMFSAVEVSGPWSVVDNNHFTKDRKKLAKNSKLMINNIYKLNISGGSHITKIKLYGVQLYQKHFYIYSLQMFCPKVYVFKEELRFDYPTSPALFRSRLPLFFKNMLYMKNCIESSLENIMIYINATDTARSSNEHFTDSTNNSPVKKKN